MVTESGSACDASVRRVRDSGGFGKRYPNQAAVAGSSPTAVRLAYPCCARVGRWWTRADRHATWMLAAA